MIPVVTREHLERALSERLRKPHRYSAGDSRIIIGRPRPLFIEAMTLFVMRVSERHRVRRVPNRQAMRLSFMGRVYDRKRYSTSKQTYIVAAIAWSTGQVAELAAFPTKAEALAALAKR